MWNAKVGMRALYSRSHSDERAEELYNNLLSGKDNLVVGSNAGEEAETTLNNKGGKTIRVASTGNDRMSRLRLGTVLGHEAHRDGKDNGTIGQAGETIDSVFAHSQMAMDMERDYKGLIASDKTLMKDVNRYNEAVMTGNLNSYAGYVLDNYDISKDYWKVIKHRNGSISMTDDGSDDLTINDETQERKKV